MRHPLLFTTLVILALTACDKKPPEKPFVPDPIIPPSGALPPGHPPINTVNQAPASTGASQSEQMEQGTVVSTITIPQFTYIEIKDGSKTRWLASKTIALKKGDVIQFDRGETVTNFSSNTLNRTFASITFVNHAAIVNKQ
jgi:hypothetical protein